MSRSIASKKRKTTPPLGSEDLTGADAGGGDDAQQVKRPRGFVAGGSTGPNGASEKQFYETKLSEMEEELKVLKTGEHPEFMEKVKALEQKKKDDLKKATMLKELRLKEIEAMYEFSVQEANDTFEGKKREIQDKMTLDTEDAIKRLKELRDGVQKKKGARGVQDEEGSQEDEEGNMGEDADEGAAVVLPNPKKSLRSSQALEKKNALSAEVVIEYAAPPNDVLSDLARIHQDWLKRAQAFRSQEEVINMAVRVEDGKLYFNESIIERGMSVVTVSEGSASEIYGTVIKITPTETIIRSADGATAKVPLAHLRAGRCKISRDVPKDGAVNAQ